MCIIYGVLLTSFQSQHVGVGGGGGGGGSGPHSNQSLFLQALFSENLKHQCDFYLHDLCVCCYWAFFKFFKW